ncbi:MAG TPA: PhzF family phenazine biosynthesis protein [Mycobacteriales bacterium]
MATLAYEIVDVFTATPFVGNPLAVVFGADGLSDAQMQSLAAEFNLSETVFVCTPTGPADYRARIFTPAVELPFAGHPSVGAAHTLARTGRIRRGEVVQECGAGLLPVVVGPTDDDPVTLTGGTPTVGPPVDAAPLLAAVGLGPDDLAAPEPRVAGCGNPFVYLSVRPDAVARAMPDAAALRRIEGGTGLSVSSWDGATATAHARVFAPAAGVPEDPATGSAAVGHGVWLVESGVLPDGGAFTIHQGAEVGRPSVLTCTVDAEGGHAVRATVAGRVVPVAAGRIRVPD